MAKFNYFYKTENLINGNFYYGVHSTDYLEDGYLGSGKRLKYAISKYGKEKFKKEILLFFDTYNEALHYESEFVNEELIIDPSCYNLMKGGRGGNNGKGEEWYRIHYQIIGKIVWNNEEYKKIHRKKMSILWKKMREEGTLKSCDWTGRKHKEETKIKMKLFRSINHPQKGEKNSQYGTCWITNGKENKKIHKGDLIPDNWRLGRKIK